MKYLFAVLSIITANTLNAQSNWKQQVDTKIDVRLDDKGHFLHGFEEFTYTNNSPDTLKFIYVHLWLNAYKNDRTPFARQQDINGNTEFYYSKKRDRGFIDSLQFSVDGRNVEHYSTEDAPDIARIDLPEPLLPGGKIKVSTPFRDKLPKVFSRGGHTDQAYYVSQWFPKPAVYDRKGWHPISYLDQGEFYSEYGSYDVSVTLPSNYVLLATGNCLDESENKLLDSLSQVPLPPFSTWLSDFPASAYTTKTVHFHEDNIHDFAWFADKRFIVRKDTVVSPGNDQLVTAWTAFLPFYQLYWKNGTEYLKTAVKYYGSLVGPYRYKTIKAVLGDMKSGGGMEYPTITLIAKTAVSSLKTVIVHEAGHNWFYGMLGSNERDHAWMDEGLNTFYEQKTIQGSRKDTVVKTGFDETLIYYQYAATNSDQPIDQPSENFEKTHYGIDIYNKTGLMLRWLELYMGENEFGEGMKDYYNTWVFRHPYPEDFRAVMSKHTSKSLDWFFETMLHTTGKIDYTISKARRKESGTEVTILNKSGVNGPAHLQAYHRGSLVADMWSEPFHRSATLTVPTTTWNRLVVSDEVPDAKTTNNVYRRSALFHHFGFRLKPVLGTNRREFDKLFVAPAVGSNLYDGFMAGLLFHDLTLPENRFRFAVAPMYAFASKTFVGSGSMGYMWYSSGLFKEILLQGDAKTYHFEETKVNLAEPLYARYIKAAPSLEFIFNEHDLRSPVTRGLLLKGYYIQEDNFNFGTQPSDVPYLVKGHTYYGRLYYHHKNERAYNPFSYNLDVHGNADFIKVGLEGNVRIDYNKPKKALYVRGYAGKFFALNNDPAAVSRYYLNSSYSGTNDYLYDGTYRGRNATSHISGQQISIQEGGFKIPVHVAVNRSDNWIGALNLATDLPLGPIPIRLFFDAGLIPNYNQGPKNVKSSTLIYDGGVEVVLSKDVASVYFPFIMSGDFRDYLNNTYGHKNVITRSISFTLQLQNINWLRLPGTGLKKILK